MRAIKLGMPIFLILLSFFFLIASINLPKANLGNPNGPLYFPVGLSVFMLIFSAVYLFQEWKSLHVHNEDIKLLLKGRTPKLIALTVLYGAVYAFIFERIGFLFSTILFLGALLFTVNGKKYVVNVIVAVSFSFLSWYAFSILLGVSLP
ncbi:MULTISPECIES: tripartite tricarboxylate transporter TctB family protein [Bacillaceae]|uniref:tripartite tricarboxylate transporter TctB family protein n=1 Tax=Bacillaceae TaxID=186817 RepID=UPI001C56480A|nr:tripartite tricarboxylate transporter TctB family protein [Rossellomorea sp. YZS02]MBW3112091.1 tripartite tricarboxylate transporter TctB family protein [Bacillus sp. MCCB 382]MDX8344741.1 tripartite tricarboxylate transporter TctB family protein [Rossellomorea sp. YZS02]